MSKTCLRGNKILIGGELGPATIEIQDGKILKITPGLGTGSTTPATAEFKQVCVLCPFYLAPDLVTISLSFQSQGH
jgi:hypothetical protein